MLARATPCIGATQQQKHVVPSDTCYNAAYYTVVVKFKHARAVQCLVVNAFNIRAAQLAFHMDYE